jgi:tetraacyldisaccharide 4'-kinase
MSRASAVLLAAVARLRAGLRRRARRRAVAAAGLPLPVVGLAAAGPDMADRTGLAALVAAAMAAAGAAPVHLAALLPGAAAGPATGRLGADLAALSVLGPLWLGPPDGLAGLAARAAAAGAGGLVVRLSPGADRCGCPRVLLALDAAAGLAGLRAWPAGPLADPAADLLAAADLVVMIGDAAGDAGGTPPRLALAPQVLRTGLDAADWAGAAVLPVGTPPVLAALVAALRADGARVVGARALDPDRAPAAALLRRIEAEARAAGARLVLGDGEAAALPRALQRQVRTVPLRLGPADPATLARLLGA